MRARLAKVWLVALAAAGAASRQDVGSWSVPIDTAGRAPLPPAGVDVAAAVASAAAHLAGDRADFAYLELDAALAADPEHVGAQEGMQAVRAYFADRGQLPPYELATGFGVRPDNVDGVPFVVNDRGKEEAAPDGRT